jgi:hypothetical protein
MALMGYDLTQSSNSIPMELDELFNQAQAARADVVVWANRSVQFKIENGESAARKASEPGNDILVALEEAKTRQRKLSAKFAERMGLIEPAGYVIARALEPHNQSGIYSRQNWKH